LSPDEASHALKSASAFGPRSVAVALRSGRWQAWRGYGVAHSGLL